MRLSPGCSSGDDRDEPERVAPIFLGGPAAGNTYMGIYANVGGGQTSQFYLARVPTAAAGHTLVLNFYDIGDASAPGQLRVVPSTDSNVGATFTGCKWSGDSAHGALGYGINTSSAPWGDMNVISNCLVTGVNASGTTWNGQWNTTSWNACLLGDPVRLTQ